MSTTSASSSEHTYADGEDKPFLDQDQDCELNAPLHHRDGSSKMPKSEIRYIAAIMILSCLAIVGFVTSLIQTFHNKHPPMIDTQVSLVPPQQLSMDDVCESLTWRREWRTLSNETKKSYIDAVLRLMAMPSKIGFNNQSRYDDFQFIHGMTLDYAHRPGVFLAWHRFFIKTFEMVLRHEAGYRDYLPYWDWTLDYKNLSLSPVFDDTTGFGGNGDPTSTEPTWRGYCVTTGPFANHIVPYRYVEVYPHCLSRDFATDDFLETINWGISPQSIHELLAQNKFSRFTNMLESQSVHLPIIKFMVGDFSTRAAPGEPLWFLHHAQIDKLYWLWQQQNPRSQMLSFDPFGDFTREETLPDVTGDELMDIGALSEKMMVKDMFDTRSVYLCYGYK